MRAAGRVPARTVAIAAAAVLLASCTGSPSSPPTTPGSPPSPTGAPPVTSPQSNAVRCDGPNLREVSSVQGLREALDGARPGTTIRMADGVYQGNFELGKAGSAQQPVTLCGSRGAVLDGGSTDSGYTVHLSGADHAQLSGFTIRGGQKGLVVDKSQSVLVESLLIEGVGDEALHLRAGSSDNVVRHNTIRRTGLRKEKFGEGVYVGSAESNWCEHSGCGPDRSDRNLVEGNDISETTAEPVDIKEGTSGGVLRGNTFSGAGTTAADSWVNVKGNDWVIVDNTGVNAPEDGFQTHVIVDGWGERNTFERNKATVNGPGYAINVTKRDRGNRVSCSNVAIAAGTGLSNVDCS
jgi:hypothetical protein